MNRIKYECGIGIAAVIVIVTFLGCGYTTRGYSFKGEKIVIIPVVNKVNITSESRRYSDWVSFPLLLEKRLTNALINKFNIDGSLTVTKDAPDAMELSCVIKDYRKETLRYTESDDVEEQRLRLYVQMKLVDAQGALLKKREVIGESEFFLTGPHRKSEEAATSDLIEDTARRIVESVVEAW